MIVNIISSILVACCDTPVTPRVAFLDAADFFAPETNKWIWWSRDDERVYVPNMMRWCVSSVYCRVSNQRCLAGNERRSVPIWNGCTGKGNVGDVLCLVHVLERSKEGYRHMKIASSVLAGSDTSGRRIYHQDPSEGGS